MKFVNRHEEFARLNHLAKLPKSSLAIVWGRRRVGKTRLLLEWAEKHGGIYYTADESSAAIQRKYFSIALERILPGFSEVNYDDWTTLFLRLAKDAMLAKWRGPIVIDELPYLIEASPELPSILQRFIDHDAKKAKLIIALCGSSQHMMHGAVLAPSAPLYGRADELIQLHPISIGYMKEALKIRTPRKIIEAYSIWGGIPRYWELVENTSGTFYQKIDKLALNPLGPLVEEPHHLLLEESPSVVHLRPILDAIGLGASRLSEVAGRTGQQATSLSRPIQRLIELDLIEREVPYGIELHNSKKALYKIQDPFIRFWFEIIAPRRSSFSQVTPATRTLWLKEGLPSLYSKTWEDLCRKAIPALTQKWNVSYGSAGRFWQGQDAEWDIVAESHDGSSLLIGEAKWISKKPSAKWLNQVITELQAKGIPPIRRKPNVQIVHAVFIPERPLNFISPKGVKIIDAKEIISALK